MAQKNTLMIAPDGRKVNVIPQNIEKKLAQGYTYAPEGTPQGMNQTSTGSSKQSAIKERLNEIKSDNSGGSNYSTNSSSILDLIRQTAESNYAIAENALRQKVAGIIGNYTNQLKGVEDNYIKHYQTVDRNAYDANEAIKAAMVRSGLIGTGIGKGYEQQNAFKANMARQDIDLQKQDEYNTINTNINNTKRDLEYALQNLLLEKNNYINTQSLQEARDLRSIERDDYWKQQQLDLAKDQFNFQKESFNKQFSLEERKQIFAENSWNKSFELDEKKFAEMQRQFNETFGLQKEQFAESKAQFNEKLKEEMRQFDKQFAFNEQVYKANMEMQEKQLAASIANSQRDYKLAMKRLEMEMQEYNDSLVNIATKNAIEESRRVDEAISYAILNMDSKTAEQYIKGLLRTSQLSQAMQVEKLKMINNALSNPTGADNAQSGFSGYDITGAGSNASFLYR